MQNNLNPTKVVTGIVRLSYANIWEPASINGSPAKYSASLIISKADTKTIDAINKAIDAAIAKKKTCTPRPRARCARVRQGGEARYWRKIVRNPSLVTRYATL